MGGMYGWRAQSVISNSLFRIHRLVPIDWESCILKISNFFILSLLIILPSSLTYANFSSEGNISVLKQLFSILLSITGLQFLLGLSIRFFMILFLQALHTCLQISRLSGLFRPIINIISSKMGSGKRLQSTFDELVNPDNTVPITWKNTKYKY